MKHLLLLSLVATLLLGACASRSREVEVVVPPQSTTIHSQATTQH